MKAISKNRPAPQGPRSWHTDELAAIDRLEVVQTALKVLCQTTGLRIALVARVTPASWTACAVLDEADFGLKPGDELELSTTY
ncbi:MAG: hypothetical protein ACR2IK_07330 [Chloroflexota bacterium]